MRFLGRAAVAAALAFAALPEAVRADALALDYAPDSQTLAIDLPPYRNVFMR